MRVRPRRAMPAPIAVRVARVAGPAVAAGALITTVAVTAWPSSTSALQAVPIDSSSPASPSLLAPSLSADRARTADRANRSETRPSMTAADEKTVMVESAREQAAEAKAAEAKAAKKKAAEKKAAELDLSVIGTRYTTDAVKLRKTPSKDAKSVDIVDEAKKIKVTETVRKGYRLVVVDGKGRWVTDDYLSKKKPSGSAGISNARCSKSSGIESGLVSNGVKVYRAICAAFPEVTSFGGRRGSNDFHGSGQAVDNMISDSAAGWRLANWLRANASKLGVSEVIYSQKIWTVQRAGEGWRGMSDRGSSTANHYDHVHVSVY
ncbi:MAG TPA: SH3 domain-containing protein [Microlunatus sp.]